MGALALAALGIVFGDIGTSPLYTLKECLSEEHGISRAAENTLGVLSLIFWSLTMVVTVKYLAFVMRADNRGEGGILALLALIPDRLRGERDNGKIGALALLVIIGAALLYGDGMITPAISVLSAMEGLQVATPSLKPFVIPITCGVLLGLFAIQKRGTGGVGKLFGPIMVVWFGTLAVLGAWHVAHNPSVLAALSPHHAISYFTRHGWKGFAVLGSVVLAVTGGEALYADMGHFGAKPIRVSWLFFVMPALVLAYFGQGALVLADERAAENPFFSMVPAGMWTYALVVLSAAATVIASQALISGAFSLTHQAVQLGFFPRVTVKHTSHEAEGQIYVPQINWLLAIACIALVLGFKESSRLAAAYGIAVTGTMAITSVVYSVVTRQTWVWSALKALPVLLMFLSFDIPFLLSNTLKFVDGGYVPVLVGAGFFVVMVNWKRGRRILAEAVTGRSPPLDGFMKGLSCTRVPGAAVFMSSNPNGTPPVLFQHARRIGVIHETVLLLTITSEHVPAVGEDERLAVEALGQGFFRIIARYGFMETPTVPLLMQRSLEKLSLQGIDPKELTYYLGRETFLATEKGQMGPVSEGLFSYLSRNAVSATAYFSIPSEQVVELGSQIDL
jgi:KUP system potassium uptake protein